MIGPAFDNVLCAAQAGAGWASSRLYESVAARVAGYARSQGVDDPEDLTSEVFLAVFDRLRTFTGNEHQFHSWVFTIAYRRIVDYRRAMAARPRAERLALGDDSGMALGAAGSAEDEALSSLELERLQRMLEDLTPDQRHVLALRVVADLSIDQVADALGKDAGAVKSLQRRALDALRRKISAAAVSR